MNLFSESISPATKDHIVAKLSYFSDLSQTLLDATRQLAELNFRFTRNVLDESSKAGLSLLHTRQPDGTTANSAAQVQPIAEKIQDYQKNLYRIGADTQMAIVKLTEEHAPQAARTASALVDEVKQKTSEQSERYIRNQQEAATSMAQASRHFSDAARQHGSMPSAASMQSAAHFDQPEHASSKQTDERHGNASQHGSKQGSGGNKS